VYPRENYWPETLTNWVQQGAPEEIAPALREQVRKTPRLLWPYFWEFFDIKLVRPIRLQQPAGRDYGAALRDKGLVQLLVVPLVPFYEPRILSEDERTVTFTNGIGQTVREVKAHPIHMPQYLDWPVKDRATWNEYKKRLDPSTPERYPADWEAFAQRMNTLGTEDPVQLFCYGFYGPLREMVGMERLAYMFYDDPNLIEDIMDQFVAVQTEAINRVTKYVKLDMGTWWEDMAYSGGSLISPAMVRKFMLPRYKKLTDLLRSKGVEYNHLDSDGDVSELLPLWLEVGININRPLEVAAGNDAVALKKKYGKDLVLSGNIDKRALISGSKQAIRDEVMSKVPYLVEQGAYFPSVDHGVPADITFESYCYYINTLREVGGVDKLPFYDPDYWSKVLASVLTDTESPRSGRD